MNKKIISILMICLLVLTSCNMKYNDKVNQMFNTLNQQTQFKGKKITKRNSNTYIYTKLNLAAAIAPEDAIMIVVDFKVDETIYRAISFDAKDLMSPQLYILDLQKDSTEIAKRMMSNSILVHQLVNNRLLQEEINAKGE